MLAMTFLGATLSVFWITLLVILWVALAFLPANIARSKGHSFWGWFVISLFFWWITLFVTLFMHDNTDTTAYTP
jgi:ABC-type Mn2+/Zn2+ transport system permease subunit